MHHRPTLIAALVAFVSSLIVYVVGAAPTTYLLDSSELVATTWSLGISHPPGHPAYHALAGLASAVPLANIAVRIHVFSALCCAACAALVPIAAARLGWARSPSEAAVFGALGVATGAAHAFAFQAIRAEVYPLNTLVVCGALTMLARARRDLQAREVGVVAVILGVGLLNHHYLTLFAFPAVAVAVVRLSSDRAAALRNIATGVAFGGATLPGYAWLAARGAAQPALAWVWPTDGARLWWLVSAQAFQKSAAAASSVDPLLTAGNLVGLLGEQFTVVGLLCAGTALALLLVRRAPFVWVFVLAMAGNLATQSVMGFDPNNPDVAGYFMPSVWMLGLLSGFVLAVPLEERARLPLLSWMMPAVAVCVCVVAVAVPRGSEARYSLATNWDSELLRDVALAPIRPDGLWVTSYFETGFNTWYAVGVEDRRPDVAHVHRAWQTYPYYVEMMATSRPETQALFGERASQGALDAAGLRAWAGRASVHIEADQILTGDEAQVCPADGLYLRCGATAQPAARLAARLDALTTAFDAPLEIQTRRNLVWTLYNLADVRCRDGASAECRAIVEVAVTLAPDDSLLAALAASVGVER